jgi:hypothetical protein
MARSIRLLEQGEDWACKGCGLPARVQTAEAKPDGVVARWCRRCIPDWALDILRASPRFTGLE